MERANHAVLAVHRMRRRQHGPGRLLSQHVTAAAVGKQEGGIGLSTGERPDFQRRAQPRQVLPEKLPQGGGVERLRA